jgi:hypothetical protein
MEQYFTKDYLGAPFELFGTAHIVALVCVAMVNILIIASRRAFTERHRRVFPLRFGGNTGGGGDFMACVELFYRPMDGANDASIASVQRAGVAERLHVGYSVLCGV